MATNSKYRKIPKFGTYTRDEVRAFFRYKLSTDKKFQLQALQALIKRQTNFEYQKGITDCRNNEGINQFDAYVLTRIYKLALKNAIKDSHYKKLKQLLPKYALQVASFCTPKLWIDKMESYFGD